MYSLSEIRKKIVKTQQLLQKSLEDVGKKKRGSYYTPDFIVEYIVKNSISQVLVDKINSIQTRKKFIDLNELKNSKDLQIFNLLYKQILPNISICDIAMGWGVFLLHAFDFLFSLYYFSHSIIKQDTSKINQDDLKQEVKFKNHIVSSIISNNIYGTDLSPLSVDLAKLKLIEKALLYLEKEAAVLPDFNLYVGNSLIGQNFASEGIKNLSNAEYVRHITDLFYSHDSKSLDEWLKEESLINWGSCFNQLNNKGGFDIIIGNPPYINVKKLNKIERSIYSKLYRTYNPNGDISNVFWERGLNLCKDGGSVSFIIPRYWLEGNDSDKLREFLLSNSIIKEIIDFRSNRSLFLTTENKLGVDTAIVSIRKHKHQENKINVLISLDNTTIRSINKSSFQQFVFNQSLLSKKRWTFEKSPIITLIEENADYNLGDDKKHKEFTGICNIGKGCSTGNNRIFKLTQISSKVFEGHNKIKVELEKHERDTLRLLIKNSDISKYNWSVRNDFWIYLKEKNIDNYPNIKNYLSNFIPELETAQEKYGLKNHYDYVAYRSLDLIDSLPKIICPYQAKENRFAILEEKNISTINETDVITLVIKEKYKSKIDWMYILSVLNSELIHYYSMIRNKKIYNLYDFRSNQIANFPIMKCNKEFSLKSLAHLLMQLQRQKHKIAPSSLIQNSESLFYIINSLVYEIYFEELLSTELNESIERHLTNSQSSDGNNLVIEQISTKLEEIFSDNLVKKDLKKIDSLLQVQDIQEFIKLYSR